MTFKAKILDVVTHFQLGTTYEPKTHFSKSQIFISPLPTHENRITVQNETINTGTRYSLDKIFADTGKKLYQITLNGKPNCTSIIRIDWYNKIKCNLLHRRYIFQREEDWFWKAIITTAIGFAFSLISLWIGYRQGYRTGLKEGQAQHQK